ncbi:hypothetical protein BU25DRAFT_223768 [Macroventuria anomochaeta]|uniref:Uncharacterized protein n=1 Tax=Macroventuria anomochaeta TaxID=301207 RepID=A0ACB6SAJ6_9PLEO|nr:uncharacterized protein BU25DRAFT_223768 [Macroventuria anomochaeta]KAF2631068.1 hypothetical protein BU25DRAFT_223768 [Macroventuria anomochaeta]
MANRLSRDPGAVLPCGRVGLALARVVRRQLLEVGETNFSRSAVSLDGSQMRPFSQPPSRVDNESQDLAADQSESSDLQTNRNFPQPNRATYLVGRTTLDGDASSMIGSTDLWSAAYREAVESHGHDIDMAVLVGNSTANLFAEQLERLDKDSDCAHIQELG